LGMPRMIASRINYGSGIVVAPEPRTAVMLVVGIWAVALIKSRSSRSAQILGHSKSPSPKGGD
jgi:hypothetical protein